MDDEAKKKAAALFNRIHNEISDDLDEEMELDDYRIADTIDGVLDRPVDDNDERRLYFRELLRLQREFINLQDWIG